MTGRTPHEALGVDPSVYDSGGEDIINAAIYERSRERSASDAVAFFRTSHKALLAAVQGLSDSDLGRPYVPDDPTDKRSLGDGIAANSYLHDAEHERWIRASLPESV